MSLIADLLQFLILQAFAEPLSIYIHSYNNTKYAAVTEMEETIYISTGKSDFQPRLEQ